MSFKHSFAKKWLKYTGYEIYLEGKRVLEETVELDYKVSKLLPFYYTGEQFFEGKKEESIREISYSELKSMGACVDARNATEQKFVGQQKDYFIKKYQKNGYCVNILPAGVIIQFDMNNNRARLVREKIGATDWYDLNIAKEKDTWRHNMSLRERVAHSRTIRNEMVERTTGLKKKSRVAVQGIIMMVLDNGCILCLPMSKKDDVGHMEFSGAPGFGKTMGLHNFLHTAYYMTDWHFYILNDAVRQTYMWTMPDENCLEYQRFGFWPAPLPLVFLAPNTPGNTKMFFEGEGLSFRFTLQYDSEDFKDFLSGIPKERNLDLGKSARYLGNLDFVDNTRTNEEIYDGLLQSVSKDSGIPKTSLRKIADVIGTFVKEGLFDKWSNVPSKWLFKKGIDNIDMLPYIGLSEAGVVPVIDTSEISQKYYYSPLMKKIATDILAHQKKKVKTEGRKSYILIDEITMFYGDKKTRFASADVIDEIAAIGRNHGLALVCTLQPHSVLSKKTRVSMRYHFAFRNTEEEARLICSDYSVADKMMPKIIGNLKERECVAISNGMPFLLYDPISGECKSVSGAFKGRIFIPPSRHKRPSEVIEEVV